MDSLRIFLRLAGAALLLFPGVASAADFYLSPDGDGKRDGSNWSNAFDQSELNKTVNERMQPGDQLLLDGVLYENFNLKITSGGAPGKPKIISGVYRHVGLPVLASNWAVETPEKGPTCVEIGPGVSHVRLQHLRIKGYCHGVKANPSPATPRSNLTFFDLDMEQFRHGFYLSHCDDLLIENCDLKRYSKHGFRFEQGCHWVTVRNCKADCSEGDAVWETQTELFPFGFIVNDGGTPNTGFAFENCLAKNNRKSNQGAIKYTNGDGFVVEGNSQDVTFKRCRAVRNQDGGFDLKVDGVRLTDCVALGQRRDFRLWRRGSLHNCLAGWSTTGLWCKEGSVVASYCTFHQHKKCAVEVEDKAIVPVVLSPPKVTVGNASVELKESEAINFAPGAGWLTTEKDCPNWDGDAGMSSPFRDKGYRFVLR